MIPRYYDDVDALLKPGKVLVIYGPRQVGKTTLIRRYLERCAFRHRLVTGEDIRVHDVLGSQRLDVIRDFAEGYDLIAIDEAQRIPGVGLGLKMLVDARPDIRVIATGSSSFDLAGQVGEPLTGRKRTLTLYPIAQMELAATSSRFDLRERLEEFLVFGSYPEVVTAGSTDAKIQTLQELASSYLLKDVLALDGIRNSRVISDLLRLLALQVGAEVSLTELGTQLGINQKTVDRYLDILEKSFVIFRLPGMGRNPRTDIRKKSKYFFYDTGIRNAILSSFNRMALRNDAGQLWENFLLIERIKRQAYGGRHANLYFWRADARGEIDLVEEVDGALHGFEFKWGGKDPGVPREWQNNVPDGSFQVVNRDNWQDFVL